MQETCFCSHHISLKCPLSVQTICYCQHISALPWVCAACRMSWQKTKRTTWPGTWKSWKTGQKHFSILAKICADLNNAGQNWSRHYKVHLSSAKILVAQISPIWLCGEFNLSCSVRRSFAASPAYCTRLTFSLPDQSSLYGLKPQWEIALTDC